MIKDETGDTILLTRINRNLNGSWGTTLGLAETYFSCWSLRVLELAASTVSLPLCCQYSYSKSPCLMFMSGLG